MAEETCADARKLYRENQCCGSPAKEVYPSSYRFIINSCGDIVGPTMEAKVESVTGSSYNWAGAGKNKGHKEWYTKTWEYMASLKPDGVFLLGDNVYNDCIKQGGGGTGCHPFGNNLASVLADADETFMKVHGFLTDDGKAGPMYYSYLEILKDKLYDGFHNNSGFTMLREVTRNGIHMHWDDHDYLTNDPSNPHFLRPSFRHEEIDLLTGFDKGYFRNAPGNQGIERSWTKTFNNHGSPFVVRFIMLDEETTHESTLGMRYVFDETSPTGFKPVRASNPSGSATLNADPAYMDDFEEPKRPFFGEDQMAWFVSELKKPADLRLVFNGGPNFEVGYSYASLTDFPGAKRRFVEALRESGAEKVVFFAGDSHASYITKVPDLLSYPLYTIVGSGQTQGLSYDRYVSYWGDISHSHLVAAGSTTDEDSTASFAEVELLFDPEPKLRFTPHLAPDTGSQDSTTYGTLGRWGDWRPQVKKNPEEMWEARYEIKLSELVNQPNAIVDGEKFPIESISIKWAPEMGAGNNVSATVTLTNAAGASKTWPLREGGSWHLCGTGYFGFCKDKYGAFTYAVPRKGDYIPSHVNKEMAKFAGAVGDTVQWRLAATHKNGSTEELSGSHVMKVRNNVLVDSSNGQCGSYGCVIFYCTQHSYNLVAGPHMGIAIVDLIDEPALYAGHKIPVKGYSAKTDTFNETAVQDLYVAYRANATDARKADLSAEYLRTYYPEVAE